MKQYDIGVTDCAQSFSLACFSAYISSSVAISLSLSTTMMGVNLVFIINFLSNILFVSCYIMSKRLIYNNLLRLLTALTLMDHVFK